MSNLYQEDQIITQNFDELYDQQFAVVYADPPWQYYGDPNKDQACGKHYKTLSEEELASLKMRRIMADKAYLLLWATSPKLDQAIRLIKAWNLHYRGVFQNWIKTSSKGKIINAQGIKPTAVKPTTEYLLLASTQPKGRTLKLHCQTLPHNVLAPRPNNQHSKKPDIFYTYIEAAFGVQRQVELFARVRRDNWSAFGNEIGPI